MKNISIVIPAYNEEKNIESLIDSINNQHISRKFKTSIEIFSDGSTDKTVELVKNKYKEIKVHAFKENLGKNKRINQIMRQNKSDILIQVDADVKIKSKNVIEDIANKMLEDEHTGIVCAYQISDEPHTLVGKMAYFGFKVWDCARNDLGKKAIRYYCEGALRGFSKKFSEDFVIPDKCPVSEDTYSFYYAVNNGFKVVVEKKAVVYEDLPLTATDYIRQMKRFMNGASSAFAYFEPTLVKKYQTIGIKERLKALWKELTKTPIIGIMYLGLQLYTKMDLLFYKPEEKWTPISR